MKKILALLTVLAVSLFSLAAQADGARKGGKPSQRVTYHAGYTGPGAPMSVVYGAPSPVPFLLAGGVIGAIIGAAVCPPCSVGGAMLTSTGGALVGGGLGVLGGGVLYTVASPQPVYAQPRVRYARR